MQKEKKNKKCYILLEEQNDLSNQAWWDSNNFWANEWPTKLIKINEGLLFMSINFIFCKRDLKTQYSHDYMSVVETWLAKLVVYKWIYSDCCKVFNLVQHTIAYILKGIPKHMLNRLRTQSFGTSKKIRSNRNNCWMNIFLDWFDRDTIKRFHQWTTVNMKM